MLILIKFVGLNEFVMDFFIKSCKVRYIVEVYLYVDIYIVCEDFDFFVFFFFKLYM